MTTPAISPLSLRMLVVIGRESGEAERQRANAPRSTARRRGFAVDGGLGLRRVLLELGEGGARKDQALALDGEDGLAVDGARVGREPLLAGDRRRLHRVGAEGAE